jgi:flagellar hook-length control protein FliK
MIFIPESPLSGQIVTLIRPVGKEIPFRLGEIIEGQVTDIFPSGGLTIKVKGGYLPIRSDLTFEKYETLFLKVLGAGKKNGEIVLQLINSKNQNGREDQWINTGSFMGLEKINDSAGNASDLLSKLLGSGIEYQKEATSQPLDTGKLRLLLRELLKALPINIQSVPKGLKTQLEQILQASVQSSNPDNQEIILKIINQLKGESQYLPNDNLNNLLIPIEELDSVGLKNSLENTGVLLEAKLGAMAKSENNEEFKAFAENLKIKNDLKAIILQLKENIQIKKEANFSSGFLQRFLEKGGKSGDSKAPLPPKVFNGIDTLVKDIETFQLLSKISESFHTFLPIHWDELKRGELVLKKRKQSKESFYSCGIHLNLEKLGSVSVFLFMQSGDFFVNIKTDHSKLKSKIRSHLEELREGFNREGINLKGVSILEKGDVQEDPLERMDYEETIINIRI